MTLLVQLAIKKHNGFVWVMVISQLNGKDLGKVKEMKIKVTPGEGGLFALRYVNLSKIF